MFRGKRLEKVAVEEVVIASSTMDVALMASIPGEDPFQAFLVVGREKGSDFFEASLNGWMTSTWRSSWGLWYSRDSSNRGTYRLFLGSRGG